jgi:two-component system nitrate/nitrite response regulator NarL
MIKIIIVDDHPIFIDGLSNMLSNVANIEIVGSANNGQQLLDLLEIQEVDVILLDINMPIMDGLEAAKVITQKHKEIKLLMLSMYDENKFVKEAIEIGAKGYILKNIEKTALVNAIEIVAGGRVYFDPEIQEKMMQVLQSPSDNKAAQELIDQITTREKEVLQQIALGMTSIEIGKKLFISKNTVETHRKNLLMKLNAKNTPTLLKIAYEIGLV